MTGTPVVATVAPSRDELGPRVAQFGASPGQRGCAIAVFAVFAAVPAGIMALTLASRQWGAALFTAAFIAWPVLGIVMAIRNRGGLALHERGFVVRGGKAPGAARYADVTKLRLRTYTKVKRGARHTTTVLKIDVEGQDAIKVSNAQTLDLDGAAAALRQRAPQASFLDERGPPARGWIDDDRR